MSVRHHRPKDALNVVTEVPLERSNCHTEHLGHVHLVTELTGRPGRDHRAAFQLSYPLRLQGANQALRFLFMHSRRLIVRHALVSLSFLLLYLLLNRPEIIFFSRIGFVAWYPAIGLVMALLLGVSPWYAVLVCFADALAGSVIYAGPVLSFSNTVDAVGVAACYGAAAYVLRGPLRIDLGLRRRRDVVRYVFVSAIAAAVATIIGVACLIADHSITWGEYKSSA